jgi:hypothetical protein
LLALNGAIEQQDLFLEREFSPPIHVSTSFRLGVAQGGTIF